MSHFSKDLLPARFARHAASRMRTLSRTAALGVFLALCVCVTTLCACSSRGSQAASSGISGRFVVDERPMFGSFTENIYLNVAEDNSVELFYRGRHVFGTLVSDGVTFENSALYHIADVHHSMGVPEEGITIQVAIPTSYKSGHIEGFWAIMYDDQRTGRVSLSSDVFMVFADGTSYCRYLKDTNVFDGIWMVPEERTATWRQIDGNRYAFVDNETGYYKEAILPY